MDQGNRIRESLGRDLAAIGHELPLTRSESHVENDWSRAPADLALRRIRSAESPKPSSMTLCSKLLIPRADSTGFTPRAELPADD
jgi:hypothetical protein